VKKPIHELEKQKQETKRVEDIAVIIAFIIIAMGLLLILFDWLPKGD